MFHFLHLGGNLESPFEVTNTFIFRLKNEIDYVYSILLIAEYGTFSDHIPDFICLGNLESPFEITDYVRHLCRGQKEFDAEGVNCQISGEVFKLFVALLSVCRNRGSMFFLFVLKWSFTQK